jgi:Fe-S-cluster containining protein
MDKLDHQAKLQIAEAVQAIYQNLDKQIDPSGQSCKACGRCCDFDSFGHRLYITTPELLYFKVRLAEHKNPILPMTGGVCPYRKDGKCSVYPWRFAGCRIFNCTGDADMQSELSEKIIHQMKQICLQESLSYGYLDLKTALNQTVSK